MRAEDTKGEVKHDRGVQVDRKGQNSVHTWKNNPIRRPLSL